MVIKMNNIHIDNFNDFSVSDIFNVLKGRNKLTKLHINENGETPLYSSTKENNGIIGYTNENPDYIINNDNPFYIIFGDHTKSMYIATSDFCVADNVKVLVPKVHNKYAIQFILTLWGKAIPDLGYSRHWSIAKKTTIKLPVDKEGKPDWGYMENYMFNIKTKASGLLSKLKLVKNIEKNKIDTRNWKVFRISEVFEMNKKGKKISTPTGAKVRQNSLTKGSTPRITGTGINNGILDYFEDLSNNQNYRVYENFISVSFLGTVFYQKNKASLDMKVHCLKPIKHILNDYTGIFLVSLITESLKEISYSDQISSSVLPELTINLPTNKEGEPDWKYMEDYMCNIEKKMKTSLYNLKFINNL